MTKAPRCDHLVAFVLDTGDYRCARCGEAVPVKSKRAVRFRPAASLAAFTARLARQTAANRDARDAIARLHG